MIRQKKNDGNKKNSKEKHNKENDTTWYTEMEHYWMLMQQQINTRTHARKKMES